MTRVGTPPENVYGIYISVGDGAGVYHDIVARPETFEGTVEQQAVGIASSILDRFSDAPDHDDVDISIVDGMTADASQCTVIGHLPTDSLQISIPARLSWAGGRPVLTIDRRIAAPWRHDGAGNAYVDWDRIERLTREYGAAPTTAVIDPYALPNTAEPDPVCTMVAEMRTAIAAETPAPPEGGQPATVDAEAVVQAAADKPAEKGAEKPPTESETKNEVAPGLPTLPSIRHVPIPDGAPSVVVMEDVALNGSDSIEWNNQSHVIRQYQVLSRKLPLLGGAAMEVHDDGPLITSLLRARFPWMDEVLEAVTRACQEQLAAGRSWFTMKPTLLVGPAGCGKSSFARALAETAGLGWNMLDCGSTHDTITISGTPRGYTTATPNFAAIVMERTSSANPVIHLDEIDKAMRSRNGYLPDAVLGMTEPVTASAYYDQCLQRKMDLTHCTWIATANDVSRFTTPMRSRFRIIEVPQARGEHIDSIIREIAGEVARDWSLSPDDLVDIPKEAKGILSSQLDKGSLRTVARSLRMLWSRDLVDNGRASLN